MLILANMFAVPGSNHIVIYIIPSLFVCLPVCPAAYCILNSNYRECPHDTFPNECNQCACRLQYNLPTDCKDLALPLAGIQTVYRVCEVSALPILMGCPWFTFILTEGWLFRARVCVRLRRVRACGKVLCLKWYSCPSAPASYKREKGKRKQQIKGVLK